MIGAIASHYVAAFNPRSIPGLVAWYSALAETGYADGATMTSWADRSGNGNHATAVGSLAPQWQATTGPSGGPAVRFRGTGTTTATQGHFLLPNVMGSATSGEILYSLQIDSPSNFSQLHAFSNKGSDADWYTFTDGKIYDGFGSTTRKTGTTPPAAATSWRRYGVWSAPSDWGSTYDGASLVSTATNTVSWVTAPTIGVSLPVDAPFKGRMSCVVIYNRKLTTTERADLNAWLVANPTGGTP